jgi:hypothetical protein
VPFAFLGGVLRTHLAVGLPTCAQTELQTSRVAAAKVQGSSPIALLRRPLVGSASSG